jgi:hypothetical protein
MKRDEASVAQWVSIADMAAADTPLDLPHW